MTLSTSQQSFGVIGGGAFGTALAETLCRAGRDVTLWARSPVIVDAINRQHANPAYLPGVTLDARLAATTDLAEVAAADIILLVTPAQATREIACGLAGHLKADTPVVLCAKGLEQATGKNLTTILAEGLPQARAAVLSGPSFAADIVLGLPTALTIACDDDRLGQQLATAIGYRNLRLYWSADVTGVQLGGAVKNVLAIAAGIVDGKQLGASAHAALVTRGFAELRRFGVAMGARAETLMGLSGLGDLILTCGSPQSRNMSLGRALGQGQTLAHVLASRRSVAEGVWTAGAVAAIAHDMGLALPICDAVAQIVAGRQSVDDAIGALLARPFKAED